HMAQPSVRETRRCRNSINRCTTMRPPTCVSGRRAIESKVAALRAPPMSRCYSPTRYRSWRVALAAGSDHNGAASFHLTLKTLPDRASIEHTGDGPRPFAVIPEAIETAAEWEAKFKPRTEH